MRVMINKEVIVKLKCSTCGNVVGSEHDLVSPYIHDKCYRCRNCDGTTFNIVRDEQ